MSRAHRSEFFLSERHRGVSAADSFSRAPRAPTLLFDALGQRVQKNVGGAKTEYIYGIDGNPVALVSGSNGGWQVGYIYLGGQLLAQYSGGTTYFVHADHLGSTRVLTDVNGSGYDNFDFLPFGEQTGGYTSTTHKFTGDERDSETGLDHTLFRQYSSSLGRWSSPDPLAGDISNPQSLNRYSYVLNNPLAFTDPLGLYCIDGQGSELPPADNPDEGSCNDNGGFWVTVDGQPTQYQVVVVTANGSSSSSLNMLPPIDPSSALGDLMAYQLNPLTVDSGGGGITNTIGPNNQPAAKHCSFSSLLWQSREFKVKAGLEGKLLGTKSGGALFKDLRTGETGGEGSISLSGFGPQASYANPAGAGVTGNAPTTLYLNVGPAQKNLTTGQMQSNLQQYLTVSAVIGVGFEFSINPSKFESLAASCSIIDQ